MRLSATMPEMIHATLKDPAGRSRSARVSSQRAPILERRAAGTPRHTPASASCNTPPRQAHHGARLPVLAQHGTRLAVLAATRHRLLMAHVPPAPHLPPRGPNP